MRYGRNVAERGNISTREISERNSLERERGTRSRHPGILRYAVEAESEIESERASESEREEMISGRKRIGGAWALASIAVMLVAASFPAGVAAQDPSQAIPGVIDLG